MGGSYTLKGVPEEFWKVVKIEAVREGITIQELIVKALRAYLEGKG